MTRVRRCAHSHTFKSHTRTARTHSSIHLVRASLPTIGLPLLHRLVARFLPPKHWQSFRRALLSREAMATPRLSHDRFMDSSAVWPPHSKAKAARCRRICCLTCSPVAQVNTHLQTFMSRNAPQPEEVIQPHILEAAERSRDESVTTISYPKDLRGSVLMCAAQLQRPPGAHCTPFLLCLRTDRCFSFARNRKNNVLRMSYRAPDEPRPNFQQEGGYTPNGRPSSDVTKGFERIYERVYY